MPQAARLPHIDASAAARLLSARLREVPRSLAKLDDPKYVHHRVLMGLRDDYLTAGMYEYALGAELGDCRRFFRKALETTLHLARMRGTFDVLAVYDISSPNPSERNRARPLGPELRHPPGTKDFSVGNSADSYWYLCLGLAIGDEETIEAMPSFIWDPHDAEYVHDRSEVCTPHEQALAYAMRHLHQGENRVALEQLSRARKSPDDYVGLQSELLESVFSGDRGRSMNAMRQLLRIHAARSHRDPWKAELYLCVPGLGLAALAVRQGVVAPRDLPSDVFLPTGFLSLP